MIAVVTDITPNRATVICCSHDGDEMRDALDSDEQAKLLEVPDDTKPGDRVWHENEFVSRDGIL